LPKRLRDAVRSLELLGKGLRLVSGEESKRYSSRGKFHGHREYDLPVELHVEHGSVDGLFLKAAQSLLHLSEWSDYLIAV